MSSITFYLKSLLPTHTVGSVSYEVFQALNHVSFD